MIIQIFHTNDIHSDYLFLKKVFVYFQTHRNDEDLYFDSGDYTDFSHQIVYADKGKMALELMAILKPTALAVGNNESDLGEDLKFLLAKYPYVCCNLTDDQDQPIPSLNRSKLIPVGDKSLLVIGLNPFYDHEMKENGYNNFLKMDHLKSQEPLREVRKELDSFKGKYDYCLLLSHSGSMVDEWLQNQCPEVDFILGGHSHERLMKPRYLQSGKGECLDLLRLEVNEDGIHFLSSEQIDLEDTESLIFDRALQEKEERAIELLTKELEFLKELDFDAYQECSLTNFICDALLKDYGGDLAIMHQGIAREALKRPVSEMSLLTNMASKLNPTQYWLTGEAIEQAYLDSLDSNHIHLSGRGPGFRGITLGTLAFSHNVQLKQGRVFLNGALIDPLKLYQVTTDDYLQRGMGYPSLAVKDEESVYHKGFIRDVVRKHLMDEDLFQQSSIRRNLRDLETNEKNR